MIKGIVFAWLLVKLSSKQTEDYYEKIIDVE
jgi:hypothetical protein